MDIDLTARIPATTAAAINTTRSENHWLIQNWSEWSEYWTSTWRTHEKKAALKRNKIWIYRWIRVDSSDLHLDWSSPQPPPSAGVSDRDTAYDLFRLLEGQAAQYTIRLHYGWLAMGPPPAVLLLCVQHTQHLPRASLRKNRKHTHTASDTHTSSLLLSAGSSLCISQEGRCLLNNWRAAFLSAINYVSSCSVTGRDASGEKLWSIR